VSTSQQTFPGAQPKPVAESDVTNLTTDLATLTTAVAGKQAALGFTPENVANKDAASGYAGLDANVFLKLAEQCTAVNAQTGTSYTVLDTDRAKTVSFNNASAVAVALPQAGASSQFNAGWFAEVINYGLGAVTITPATSVMNGSLTAITLQTHQSVLIVSDGTNYVVLGLLTPLTPASGQVLAFNSSTNQWEPTTLSAIGNANAAQIKNIPVTGNAPTDSQSLVASVFAITSVQIATNVAIFQSVNTLAAGDQVYIAGLGTATFLNGQLLTVLSSGLSGTQFKANFTHVNYGPTGDTGRAETIYWKNALPQSTTVAVTTASLAAGAIENDALTMAKMFTVYQVVVSGPARVRLYSTSAARTADASRSNQVPPTPGTQHGIIADLYLDTADKYTWTCSPAIPGFNNDGTQATTIYAAITNLSGAPAAITATLYYVPQES
jgi:hypothetical protein